MTCHLKETVYDCDAKTLCQAAVYILRQDIPAARDVFSGDYRYPIRAIVVIKSLLLLLVQIFKPRSVNWNFQFQNMIEPVPWQRYS